MIRMQGDLSAEDIKSNHEKEMAMYADEAAIAKVTEEYTNLFNECDVNQDGRLDLAELIQFNKKSFAMGAEAGFKMPALDDATTDSITEEMYAIMNTLEDGEGISLALINGLEETVGVEVKKKQGLM